MKGSAVAVGGNSCRNTSERALAVLGKMERERKPRTRQGSQLDALVRKNGGQHVKWPWGGGKLRRRRAPDGRLPGLRGVGERTESHGQALFWKYLAIFYGAPE